MATFCFVFYTLVTVLFLLMCIGEKKTDAKIVYAVIAMVSAATQISIGIR